MHDSGKTNNYLSGDQLWQVALDPLPGLWGRRFLELLTIGRTLFARRFIREREPRAGRPVGAGRF